MRVAIIGGGISGLTTAFYLEQERRRGAPVSFTVFEAAPRFGGVIQTERVADCIIEAGPDSFLSTKPWARELCDDLRLSAQLIGSRDQDRKTYILIDGRLEPIPPGMQMMVEAVVRQLPREALRSSRTVVALKAHDNAWQLTSGEATEDFDHVILALPAHGSAKLLADLQGAERPVELLGEISYNSAVTVPLAYKANSVTLPPGFGFLVPRTESRRMIACTFVHNKFENRAPENTALLRVFLGGARDAEVIDLTDEQILELVRRELREILRIEAEPQLARVFKWHKAMPQYSVGHLLRIARLEMHMQRSPS